MKMKMNRFNEIAPCLLVTCEICEIECLVVLLVRSGGKV